MAFAIGDRSARTHRKLWSRVPAAYQAYASFSDFREAYQKVVPIESHQQVGQICRDSADVNYMERWNCTLRLWLGRFTHKTVTQSRGEYPRDEDGDGFHEVHVNTLKGFWSLLRSWLRPYRGISQEKLPLYLGFFEFVHNVRRRGKALLSSLLALLLAP